MICTDTCLLLQYMNPRAFLKENNDKIVVLKVYAPWCRACKGLEPKYQQIANSKDYEDMPAVQFTSMSIQNNKDYIKSLGVLALPTVQLYKHGKLVDNFPCGPSKVPILKKKLAELVNTSVDETTGKLKAPSDVVVAQLNEELVTEKPEGISPIKAESTETDADEAEYLSQEQIRDIKTSVPFFESLSESDYDAALQKAKILTFDTGAIIMREGNFGNSFYVMLKGEVEICQRTAFEDPLIAPTDYIGTVINRLTAGDWFGERALITGEPRAASIRVTEPMRALAFQKEDLPPDCVLSGIPATIANNTIIGPDGQRSAIVDSVNEKYGVSMKELDEMETKRQIRESIFVNQKRGSVNKPKDIPGVDTDEDVEEEEAEESMMEDPSLLSLREKSAAIIPLLEKFKLIQLVSKCFDYIVKNRAQWGDPAIRRRRLLLVNSLPRSQREEFIEAFRLVDANKDGGISMSELKQVMETIGEDKSADDLNEIIPRRGQTNPGGEDIMTLEDFMGIMAEAEFYYLFRDVFASLDTRGEGFVKAADLDRVLCGVRDLISDDRHSIIDVEDKDMSIDYEQFTRMLLGLSLSP